ncbi:MAG: beta-ketoacyl-[acyl-carrier-protein] synthase family protein [Pseudomonadota bacterium]|nr:beta-ketoacyl-[acyl-carrier-protein] synthase family protein [Pseudomonadota bacterium]
MRRVAITGLGILSPVGNSPAGVFSNLMAGRSGVNRIAAAFSDRLSVKIAAEVSFAPYEYFSHTKLRTLDRVSQFALVATSQALTDAALALDREDPTRAGVFLGTGMGGAATTEGGYVALYRENADRLQPYTVLMAMNNAAASWVALEHGLEGPSLTFSTACSSSAVAIGEAARQISCGEADIMLAGGTEAPLTYGTMKAWESLRTLAVEDADDASTSCRPFSKDRTGFVLGEGAAILVLEEMDRALRRGAAIYGELIGYSLSTDSSHMTRPSAEGQIRAMRSALEDAAIAPDAIDYINAHGTATVQNDAVETAAIKQVFDSRAYHVPISSTKSMHGHLLGAAGAVEFLIAVLALKYQAVPPTANLRIPDPTCDLDYVPNEGRTVVNIRTVMSNSFAFGGTSAVLIARRL